MRLHRDPTRSWPLAELAHALGQPRLAIAEALGELVAHGLASVRDDGARLRWYYRPGSRRVDEHVGLLARAAQERRMDVIRLILTCSLDRIRSAVALASLEQVVGSANPGHSAREPPK